MVAAMSAVKANLVTGEKINVSLKQSSLLGWRVLEEEVKVKLRPDMITPIAIVAGGTDGGNNSPSPGVNDANLCEILKGLLFSKILPPPPPPPPPSNLVVQQGGSNSNSSDDNDKELRIIFDAAPKTGDSPIDTLNVTLKGTPLEDMAFLFGADKKEWTLKMTLSNVVNKQNEPLLPPGKRARFEEAEADMCPRLNFDNSGSVIFTTTILNPFGGRWGGGTAAQQQQGSSGGATGTGRRGRGGRLSTSGGRASPLQGTSRGGVAPGGGDGDDDPTSSLEFSADLSIIITTKQEHCTDLLRLNKRMLSEQFRADMAVVARNGAVIPCHKTFLTSLNRGQNRMIDNGLGPTNQLILNDLSEATARAMLAYLYYGDVEKPKEDCELAMKLLQTGQKYSVANLDQTMTRILLEQPTPNFPLFVAFRLFFFANGKPELEELKKKCAEVMKLKRNELNAFQEYNDLFSGSPGKARELCNALLDV